MSSPLVSHHRHDLQGLIQAVTLATSEDRLDCGLTPAHWDALGGYLQPHLLSTGEVLFNKGERDAGVYLIESGTLSVHLEDSKGHLKLAILGPGSVVGEGAFFSRQTRMATVQATSACRLWLLSALRFSELSNRQPALALSLAMGFGALMARRMSDRRRRVATT
jgi:CRP-like cAMP-binding protein